MIISSVAHVVITVWHVNMVQVQLPSCLHVVQVYWDSVSSTHICSSCGSVVPRHLALAVKRDSWSATASLCYPLSIYSKQISLCKHVCWFCCEHKISLTHRGAVGPPWLCWRCPCKNSTYGSGEFSSVGVPGNRENEICMFSHICWNKQTSGPNVNKLLSMWDGSGVNCTLRR